jgi:hypothetical protein
VPDARIDRSLNLIAPYARTEPSLINAVVELVLYGDDLSVDATDSPSLLLEKAKWVADRYKLPVEPIRAALQLEWEWLNLKSEQDCRVGVDLLVCPTPTYAGAH